MKYKLAFFLLMFFAGCSNNKTNNHTSDNFPVVNLEGKELFYRKCASCHMVNRELTGPALKGVESRWPDKKRLYDFIRNSQEVIKADGYAHDLWMRYNQTIMPPHPGMSDEDVRNMLEYINAVSENANL